MPYIAINPTKLESTSVGSGQCVAFVQAVSQAGPTRNWKRGQQVMGATLAVGTAIATFDENGRYANDTHGRSHAAIYLGQDATGILVLDQWIARKKRPDGTMESYVQPVHKRVIRFRSSAKEVNDGRNYYVIE